MKSSRLSPTLQTINPNNTVKGGSKQVVSPSKLKKALSIVIGKEND